MPLAPISTALLLAPLLVRLLFPLLNPLLPLPLPLRLPLPLPLPQGDWIKSLMLSFSDLLLILLSLASFSWTLGLESSLLLMCLIAAFKFAGVFVAGFWWSWVAVEQSKVTLPWGLVLSARLALPPALLSCEVASWELVKTEEEGL